MKLFSIYKKTTVGVLGLAWIFSLALFLATYSNAVGFQTQSHQPSGGWSIVTVNDSIPVSVTVQKVGVEGAFSFPHVVEFVAPDPIGIAYFAKNEQWFHSRKKPPFVFHILFTQTTSSCL